MRWCLPARQLLTSVGWAVRRPGWVLAVTMVMGALLGFAALGTDERLSSGGYIAEGTEAARAETVLRHRFDAGISDLVLHIKVTRSVDDPEVARAGADFTQRVAERPEVREALSYWTTGESRLVSHDRDAALVVVDLRGDDSEAARHAATLVPRLTGVQGELHVSATGSAWVMAQATELSRQELFRTKLIGLPLAVLLLLFAFGSLTAALLPAVVGGLSVVGTLAVLRLLTDVMPVSVFASNITTALGLGLAIDYALFVVTRYREELAAFAPGEAIARTMRTAGRTVLFSASTVVACLSALLLYPLGFLRSLAVAGITVVVLAAVITVLVLPALLSVIGTRIDRGDLFAPLRRRRGGSGRQETLWSRMARLATGRPVLVGGMALLFLVTLAIPFGHVRFGVTDERVLPKDVESHATATLIEREFPLPWNRTVTVLLPDVDAVDQQSELDAYARRISALPGVHEVSAAGGWYAHGRQTAGPTMGSLTHITDGATWLGVTASGSPDADQRLVETLRALPSPGTHHLVAGRPARVLDTKNTVLELMPWAAAVIIGSVLLLLFLFTGSVLIPVKAVLMGILSLTASFGAMVYVFQDGHLRSVLGNFPVTGELETSMPVLVFGAAFALSVDYELFLVSRMQEEYRATGDHRAAVVAGVARTGRMMTAAALILAVALFPLVTSDITLLKLVGCGLALAVLVDATIVRGLLVPAFMQVTGHANWWAPRPLAAVHRRLGLGMDKHPASLSGDLVPAPREVAESPTGQRPPPGAHPGSR
ncbi:MMPL family transporter [Streptomyces sp. NPDC093546]|uniref:MMPL family transporter n=1 Tax=Streptomyces sp. NPDC093546 TaxID=3366040 RepID=UPI003827855D